MRILAAMTLIGFATATAASASRDEPTKATASSALLVWLIERNPPVKNAFFCWRSTASSAVKTSAPAAVSLSQSPRGLSVRSDRGAALESVMADIR